MPPALRAKSSGVALIAASILLLVVHAALVLRFTIDDAYITFTYAKNLAAGKGFVFMSGERVEATSSALWALLLAPFEALSAGGSVVGSKVLGLLSLLGTALAGILLVRDCLERDDGSRIAAAAFAVLLAGASPFVTWSVYGMENGLVALLLVASTLLFLRELRAGGGIASALSLSLLQAARPEGFVYVAVFAAFRFLAAALPDAGGRRGAHRSWFVALGSCLIAYEGFGLAYFGHLLPNTVSAKVEGLSAARVWEGVTYLRTGSALLYTFLLVASAGLAVAGWAAPRFGRGAPRMVGRRRDETPTLLMLVGLAVHWSFVAFVGGDWMVNARFLSHAIPLLLVVTVVSVRKAVPLLGSRRASIPSPAAAVAALIGVALFWNANVSYARDAFAWQASLQRAEERALSGLASRLNELPGAESFAVACSDVGRVGYLFRGRVLDWWGLADEEIARSGQACGRVDPAVVLRRRPEFIVLYSNAPQLAEDSMESGIAVYSRRFFTDPEFRRSYRQIAALHFWHDRWHALFRRIPTPGREDER